MRTAIPIATLCPTYQIVMNTPANQEPKKIKCRRSAVIPGLILVACVICLLSTNILRSNPYSPEAPYGTTWLATYITTVVLGLTTFISIMIILSEDETKECSTMTNIFIISIIFSALIFFATLLSACINQYLGESNIFFALRVMSTAVSASLPLAI